jgi:hypothetical protein
MVRGNKGFFSLARAKFNRLRRIQINDGVITALRPLFPQVISSLILDFVKFVHLTNDQFAKEVFESVRRWDTLPVDIIYGGCSKIEMHLDPNTIWCHKGVWTLRDLNDIHFMAESVCSWNPKTCDKVHDRTVPRPHAILKLEVLMVAFLNTKILQHENKLPLI